MQAGGRDAGPAPTGAGPRNGLWLSRLAPDRSVARGFAVPREPREGPVCLTRLGRFAVVV